MNDLGSLDVSLVFPTPVRVEPRVLFRIEELDPFLFPPLRAVRKLGHDDRAVESFPHEPVYEAIAEDVFQMMSTGARDASVWCYETLPRHRYQIGQDAVTAIASGGPRVESFVRDGATRCWSVSKSTAVKLLQSGLTGVELFPIEIVGVDNSFAKLPDVFGLLFRGAPCNRMGAVSGPTRCTRCHQRAVHCELCGQRFFQCWNCQQPFSWTIHDSALDDGTSLRVEDGIAYRSEEILDGRRYDGSDFVASATHFFISHRAVRWLCDEGVRGFAIRNCLLAYT